ncbi:MAG: peptidoglycan DD-metalloendopeptidase family protein [Peptococcus niger]|nr:peptidoglycan DD-metalloendopeptidase family protein [Peptococcus niger]
MHAPNKVLASCLMLSMAGGLILPQAAEASSVQDLQNKKSHLEADIKAAKADRDKTAGNKRSNAQALEAIQAGISTTKQRIGILSDQISASEGRIAEKEAEIEQKQKEFDARKAKLNERLVEIYKKGDNNFMEVLFQSENFSDFLTRFEYMSMIAKKDQDLLREIATMQKNLQADKAALEEERTHYNALKSEQVDHQAGLERQEAEKQELAKNLSDQEASLNERIVAMNAASADIGNQIVAIQQREAEAARARAAQLQAQQQAAQGGQLPANMPSAPITVSAGGYVWPVPSSHMVSSRYGWRVYPFGGTDFHMGQDIAAPMGTPIVASRSGKIIIQVYHPSYGNYVVIDHGDGVSTVYAHMSAFASSLGATVNAGEIVGFMGSTGDSTGSHLHFEVRINGQHTDPAAYIGC